MNIVEICFGGFHKFWKTRAIFFAIEGGIFLTKRSDQFICYRVQMALDLATNVPYGRVVIKIIKKIMRRKEMMREPSNTRAKILQTFSNEI